MITNIRELADELARQEGLSRSLGGTPQVLELLGLLGARWRAMPHHQMLREVSCVVERAGLRSAHIEGAAHD